MIGTIRGPIPGSFTKSFSKRTNAIVVATSCAPEPRFTDSYASSPGSVNGFDFVRRDGIEPPSAARRSIKYLCSGDPSSKR